MMTDLTTARTDAATVLREAGPVFLDFDGPVTGLFLDGRAEAIAERIRASLAGHDVRRLPMTSDPLAVLRWARQHCDAIVYAEAEQTSIQGEVAAAEVTEPTEGAHDFLAACHAAHRPAVILSNNAPEAIGTYLDRHQLRGQVLAVVGRRFGYPELMKPHRALVDQALAIVGQSAERCVFVGDSLTDLEAATTTGLRFIGYGKSPRRSDELRAAGAEAVIEHMGDLAITLLN